MRPFDSWTDEALEEWVGDRAFRRAQKLVKKGALRMHREDADWLEASFEERGVEFRAMIQPGEDPAHSRTSCTCPEFEEGPCSHAAALILTARRPARSSEDPNAKLQAALASFAATARDKSTDTARILGFQIDFGVDAPLRVKAMRLRPGTKQAEALAPLSLADHPPPYAEPAALGLLDVLRPFEAGRYYAVPPGAGGPALFESLKAATVFVSNPKLPLRWADGVWHAKFHTEDFRDGVSATGRLVSAEGTRAELSPRGKILQVAGRTFFYDGAQTLYELALSQPDELLEAVLPGPYYVTPRDIERWASEVLPRLQDWGEVELQDTRTPTLHTVKPKPVVVLEAVEGTLRVSPRYRYPPSTELVPPEPAAVFVDGQDWYRRDLQAEGASMKLLKALLITEPVDSQGRWQLEGERALHFVDVELAKLEGAWEVFGEEHLARWQVTGKELVPHIRVSSQLDWFDVRFEFRLDEEIFDGWELLRMWDRGHRYLRTAEGYVRLPAELLKRLRKRLADLPENGRFRRSQAGVLLGLVGDAPSVEADRAWRDTAKALENLRAPTAIALPEGLDATLRPYQQDGLNWLSFLAANRFGGILADDMGLGKTLQTIAFLMHWHRLERPTLPPPPEDPDIFVPQPVPGTLVVAPSSVVFNWARELEKFGANFSVLRWTGEKRHEKADELDTAEIVITNYAILRRDIELFAKRRWRSVVLDEAQVIKNAGSLTAECARALTADFRLALSGTPIENHLGELWSYFEFIMPGFFGGMKGFQNTFIKRIEKPEVKEELRRRISPFVLRRLKQDVATDLPSKTEIVMSCEFSEAQRNAYESVRAAYKLSLFEKIEKEGLAKSRIHVLEALLRLRQACCDPRLLPYEHTKELADSAKLDAFLELAEEATAEDHKMVVFSQFTEMLNILEAAVAERGIGYVRLDGSTADRETPVTRFQEDDDCKLILVSLRAGGTGLNLTAADYVVHYDPWWNPAVEDQATDRAYRIGQTRPVFVYKLIVENSVEEHMIELQSRKRGLVDGLLGDEAVSGSLSMDDLKAIFE